MSSSQLRPSSHSSSFFTATSSLKQVIMSLRSLIRRAAFSAFAAGVSLLARFAILSPWMDLRATLSCMVASMISEAMIRVRVPCEVAS
jgi:hypothetical protein